MANPSDQSGFVASGGNQIQNLRFNIFQASSWLSNLSRKFLEPFDVTPKQYSILSTLAKKHPESMSIQEVRDSLADKMSDASRLIDRLEKKNLLEKFPSDFDRRSNRARVTDKGIKLLKKVTKERVKLDESIASRLSEAEIKQLNGLLGRLK